MRSEAERWNVCATLLLEHGERYWWILPPDEASIRYLMARLEAMERRQEAMRVSLKAKGVPEAVIEHVVRPFLGV